MGIGGDEAAGSVPAAAAAKADVLDKLRELSIKEDVQSKKADHRPARPPSSQYSLNYRPLVEGLRKRLWEEGYKYRNERKLTGFTHEKIEWRMATDRGKSGDGSRPSSAGGRRRFGGPGDSLVYEQLNLPPTKLEKKRLKLKRMYERQQMLSRRPMTAYHSRRRRAANDDDDTPGEKGPLTSYDRNKMNNMKSHIALPSYYNVETPTSPKQDGERSAKAKTSPDGKATKGLRSSTSTMSKKTSTTRTRSDKSLYGQGRHAKGSKTGSKK